MLLNRPLNKPSGGFPPIIKCTKSELKLVDENKNREFQKAPGAISIKDIMTRRINKTTNNI